MAMWKLLKNNETVLLIECDCCGVLIFIAMHG